VELVSDNKSNPFSWSRYTMIVVVGGNPGAGFAPDNQTPYLRGSDERLVSNNLHVSVGVGGSNTKAWSVFLGGNNNTNVLFGFGAFEDAASIYAGRNNYPAYQLNYNQHAA